MLKGKKILLTTGPTQEAIDPVRYIGNRSSGKMGHAIAMELANRHAELVLVSGPTQIQSEHPNIKKIDVETAEEMYQESIKVFESCDIAILTAAVADFTPEKKSELKIKKALEGEKWTLTLVKTKDILGSLGKIKKDYQLLAGFSLETDHEIENALKKLRLKNLDFIVMNSLKEKGAGFSTDTNKITILGRNGDRIDFPLKKKTEVAFDIVNYLETLIK